MIRKRLGKTLLFRWPIITNGEASSLYGRNLTLFIIEPSGKKRQVNYTIDDTEPNRLLFTFQGKDQTSPGIYGLELWENKDSDDQTIFDKINAFELVKHTKDEGGCGCKRY